MSKKSGSGLGWKRLSGAAPGDVVHHAAFTLFSMPRGAAQAFPTRFKPSAAQRTAHTLEASSRCCSGSDWWRRREHFNIMAEAALTRAQSLFPSTTTIIPTGDVPPTSASAAAAPARISSRPSPTARGYSFGSASTCRRLASRGPRSRRPRRRRPRRASKRPWFAPSCPTRSSPPLSKARRSPRSKCIRRPAARAPSTGRADRGDSQTARDAAAGRAGFVDRWQTAMGAARFAAVDCRRACRRLCAAFARRLRRARHSIGRRSFVEAGGRQAPRFCHFDLLPDNFVVDVGSDDVNVSIVDFEYANAGQPLMDLAVLSMGSSLSPAEERTLVASYLEVDAIDDAAAMRFVALKMLATLRETFWERDGGGVRRRRRWAMPTRRRTSTRTRKVCGGEGGV